jgi:hypothetical protein
MKNHRIHRSVPRAEVEQLISDYERSGLTQREFARERGLKLTTFQYWLYRRSRPSPPGLVEVQPADRPAEAPTHYRLEFPGGRALSFSGTVRPEELEQLCQLLRD